VNALRALLILNWGGRAFVAPGRLETLKGDRKGQWSIRINDRWRICFEWQAGDAERVEIVDYH
jgi:proteic killer suppression protein